MTMMQFAMICAALRYGMLGSVLYEDNHKQYNEGLAAVMESFLVEVEELASLIKDDLFCKHLVLSVEQAMISFIQDGASLDGILELQPMSSYCRLLLHRLADIYGFAHESVGDGEGRHLVLQRCMDTSIPPILLSDALWEYGHQPASSSKFIMRKKECPDDQIIQALSPSTPLAEREAAYQAARERIFAMHSGNEQDVVIPKSRKVPAVARRMIAHALGQRINSTATTQKLSLDECEENEMNQQSSKTQPNDNQIGSNSESYEKLSISLDNKPSLSQKGYTRPSGRRKKAVTSPCSVESVSNGSDRMVSSTEDIEKQHIGAAKRIFAHALGLSSGKLTAGLPLKLDERK